MKEVSTDRQIMHLDEDFEREGWAAAFGVSVRELMEAVEAVGNSVAAVREYLRKPEGSATVF
jgi:acyl dehydratase